MNNKRLLQLALFLTFIFGAGAAAAAILRGGGAVKASVSQGTGLQGSVNPNGSRILMQSSHQPIVASTNKNGAKVLVGIQSTARTVPEVNTAGWQIH